VAPVLPEQSTPAVPPDAAQALAEQLVMQRLQPVALAAQQAEPPPREVAAEPRDAVEQQ